MSSVHLPSVCYVSNFRNERGLCEMYVVITHTSIEGTLVSDMGQKKLPGGGSGGLSPPKPYYVVVRNGLNLCKYFVIKLYLYLYIK